VGPFRLIMLCAAVLVGGCAIKPETTTGCNIQRRELAVNDPLSSIAPGMAAPKAREGTLAYDLAQALAARAMVSTGNGEDAMLFMSGGSQNGAFGAGLLRGWQKKRGKLPEFAVVTGVSTGSILATFAFVGDGDAAVRGYTIASERELLQPYIKAGSGGIGASAGLTLLRRGALANLVPLRSRISTALTDDVLMAVAKGKQDKRALFIGAVDVDSGEAVAFDLTDLAARWAMATDDPPLRAKLKNCYVEAILASSSAPIAAPPVFIDNRMYVDGGARFGVFSDEIGKVIQDRAGAAGLAEPATTYVIINGDQKINALCPWESCSLDAPPPNSIAGMTHREWNFLDLAQRSEQILVNQVYRFSADKIKARADNQGRLFRFFKIGDDVGRFEIALPDSGDTTPRNCGYWADWDRNTLRPLQFYPHYMRCLIGYGSATAEHQQW